MIKKKKQNKIVLIEVLSKEIKFDPEVIKKGTIKSEHLISEKTFNKQKKHLITIELNKIEFNNQWMNEWITLENFIIQMTNCVII